MVYKSWVEEFSAILNSDFVSAPTRRARGLMVGLGAFVLLGQSSASFSLNGIRVSSGDVSPAVVIIFLIYLFLIYVFGISADFTRIAHTVILGAETRGTAVESTSEQNAHRINQLVLVNSISKWRRAWPLLAAARLLLEVVIPATVPLVAIWHLAGK